MGLFKSKDERRIERDLEIRKGLAGIKRNIKQLEKHEREYLKKAQRAKRINSSEQLGFLKVAVGGLEARVVQHVA